MKGIKKPILSLIMLSGLLPLALHSQVDTAWVRRYDGPGNDVDRASAVAVDGSGNVYVTGASYGSGTFVDYATIKYNSAGVEQWVRRYNGPANFSDRAFALAVDGSGNVYVTGWSTGTAYDYATIKYNSVGETLWVRRYNGPGDSIDGAYALAVDGSGNVYVTGKSMGIGANYDYATIKYNSAGTEQWIRRYDGPLFSTDFAYAIAVDGSGNVYVTGGSDGAGTGSDYTTIKYNTVGETLWVRRYSGPVNPADDYAYAIVLDASSNVYVTGGSYSSTSYDYATVKYDSAGVTQWVSRYNGPGNDYDEAPAIAVDGSGSVYVTGWSAGTAWDYATIKYNSVGETLWVRRYNGPGNSADEAWALAVDGSNSVYVTGRSVGSGSGYDYATIKYNSAGAVQWVARYNGPGNADDEAYALAVDGSNNVYVTGGSNDLSASYDYVTIKYVQTGGIEEESSGAMSNEQRAMSLRILQNPTTVRQGIRLLATGYPPHARLRIYDVAGKLVQSFALGPMPFAPRPIALHPGVYFVQLKSGSLSQTTKILLIN